MKWLATCSMTGAVLITIMGAGTVLAESAGDAAWGRVTEDENRIKIDSDIANLLQLPLNVLLLDLQVS